MTTLATRRCLTCGLHMETRRGFHECHKCERNKARAAKVASTMHCPLARESVKPFSRQWWRRWT